MSNSLLPPGGYRPRSYSTYRSPKLDPDVKRVMDNVNKDTQRLANEAPEKSPQPILDSLKNGRCKNTLAGRFRALAAGLFTAKGSHNVGFEITTASLVGRRGEPGSAQQLKIKLSSLARKGRNQELADAQTAVGICNKARLNPEQITTRDLEILENIEKSLPKDSELFQEVQSAAIEVLYHMVNNGEISDNLKNSIRTHCQERCDYLNASDKNTNTVSMDDVLKLGFLYTSVNGESTNAEKSEPGTPVDILAHSFLRIHSLDLSNLMNHLNIRDNDIFKDHDGIHSLRNLQNAIQPYLTNPQTADDVLQLESNYKLLKPFLPKDSTLQDVQKQAAQSYFDHTWQSIYKELSEGTTFVDTQKLEEAHSILQKYAPDISISEDMKTTLSWAIQIACQNVQKTEQELETASAAYAALPSEDFNYDDLNDIHVYQNRDYYKLDNFFQSRELREQLDNILYGGKSTDEVDLTEIAGGLKEYQKTIQDRFSDIQKDLHQEGGVVPEVLETAGKDAYSALKSLENALKTEISSPPEGTHKISENLNKAIKEAENALRGLDEVYNGPAINEELQRCYEAQDAQKAQRAAEEAKAKAEAKSKAQLQRDLVIADYNSAIAKDSSNNRAGLEIVCLSLGKFLPSDDPALNEVEKLVPGFKDKLNASQDSGNITNPSGLGLPPSPPVPSEENLAFVRALEEGPDSQAMKDWEAKYGNTTFDYSDLPPPPGDFSGLGDLPPPPGGLGDLPPPPEELGR